MPAPVVAPVVYLHGFASSRYSTKAAYFADRLREHGVDLRCPDFNEPDFRTMTLTRMLEQVGCELAEALHRECEDDGVGDRDDLGGRHRGRAGGEHVDLQGSSIGVA